MNRFRSISILALALVALVVPSAAHASPEDVIAECTAGGLGGGHSRADLEGALGLIEEGSDLVYTQCADLINARLTAPGGDGRGDGSGGGGASGGAGGPGGSDGSGGSNGFDGFGGFGSSASGDPLSALEEDASALGKDARGLTLSDLAADGRSGLSVGGRTIEPGGDGLLRVAQAANGLPTPMLLALIAIGALMLVTSLIFLRRRVPVLARLPLLSRLPAPPPVSLRRGSRLRFRR